MGGPATPASDLYSLGVVGYQCLTGAVPFEGIPHEVTAAHRHRTLPPLPPAVPAGVAELILDLTARDPAARPASAGEAAVRAGRLRDALAGRPTAAPPAGEPGGPPPPRRWARSRSPWPEGRSRCRETRSRWPVGRFPWPEGRCPAGERLSWAGGPVHPAGGPVPGAGDPATLADASPPDMARAHRRPRPGRMRPARGLVLAVAGVAVVAGLAGWLLAAAFGAGPQQAQPGGPQPAAGRRAPRALPRAPAASR